MFLETRGLSDISFDLINLGKVAGFSYATEYSVDIMRPVIGLYLHWEDGGVQPLITMVNVLAEVQPYPEQHSQLSALIKNKQESNRLPFLMHMNLCEAIEKNKSVINWREDVLHPALVDVLNTDPGFFTLDMAKLEKIWPADGDSQC